MKKLMLEVFCYDEHTDVYDGNEDDFDAHVTVELTDSDIDTIRWAAQMCRDHDLSYIYKWDYSPNWSSLICDGEPLRWDVGQLIISSEGVRWQCYLKHTDIKIATERFKIADL